MPRILYLGATCGTSCLCYSYMCTLAAKDKHPASSGPLYTVHAKHVLVPNHPSEGHAHKWVQMRIDYYAHTGSPKEDGFEGGRKKGLLFQKGADLLWVKGGVLRHKLYQP